MDWPDEMELALSLLLHALCAVLFTKFIYQNVMQIISYCAFK
jgi:hypothetical protein